MTTSWMTPAAMTLGDNGERENIIVHEITTANIEILFFLDLEALAHIEFKGFVVAVDRKFNEWFL